MVAQNATHQNDARVLLLAIELNSSRGKTLNQLISDGFFNTKTPVQDKSIERTFYRYLNYLHQLGIKTTSYTLEGQTYYKIDKFLTYAEPTDIHLSAEQAFDLFALTSAYIQCNNLPYVTDVQNARNKLAQILDITGEHHLLEYTCDTSSYNHRQTALYHTCVEAWSHAKQVSFDYLSKTETVHTYTAQIWGMFDRLDHTYLVCHICCETDNTIKTFRLDRIDERSLTVDQQSFYTIPSWFDSNDYRGLPFSFGDNPSRDACFLITNNAPVSHFDVLTESLGTWQQTERGFIWNITFRDLPACASWAAGAALEGLAVISPPDLVEMTRTILMQAVDIHGA
ncbi:MAG: WYL domain-containing protein [Coriobacteriales bacterium]|nr:WYL domain-containing protein [Coriobacteriales bacterium]